MGHLLIRMQTLWLLQLLQTNDPAKNFFDTHHIEDVIDLVLSVNPEATMVIKSTIPVGYCRSLYVKYAQKFAQMVPLPDGKTS